MLVVGDVCVVVVMFAMGTTRAAAMSSLTSWWGVCELGLVLCNDTCFCSVCRICFKWVCCYVAMLCCF